jgi:hypothetical protein
LCPGDAPKAVCDHAPVAEFCCIRYPDGMGYNTEASSLFDAAVTALHWCEVECRTFNTARHFRDDQVLVIHVGTVPPSRCYRVQIGKAREWGRLRRADASPTH